MKYFQLILLAITITSSVLCAKDSLDECKQVLKCINGGVFSAETCTCQCLPNYAGDVCQNLVCSIKDSVNCLSFKKADCIETLISSYCPHLCEKCAEPVQPELVRNRQLTTTCLNSGQFSSTTQKCSCFPTYTGASCETLLCNTNDPASCQTFGQIRCNVSLIRDYCPTLCGKCVVTPAPQTTRAQQCPQTLTCQNSGVFNTKTCTCECFTSFTGNLCEQLTCTGTQPASCSTLDPKYCTSPQVSNYCTIMCGKCSAQTTRAPVTTPVVTTPALTTKPLTTTPKPCGVILPCQNLGKFNNTTCKCDCFLSYTGILCETLACNAEPAACSTRGQYCSLSQIATYCPITCGKCVGPSSTAAITGTTTANAGTTNANTETTTANTGTTAANTATTTANTETTTANTGTTTANTGTTTANTGTTLANTGTTTANTGTTTANTGTTTANTGTTTANTGTTTANTGTTTATTACAQISCARGETFSLETCKCNCLPGFTGKDCSEFRSVACIDTFVDTPDCFFVTCDGTPETQKDCPKKCLCI